MGRSAPSLLVRGLGLLAVLFFANRAESMTIQELVDELKKMDAGEVGLISSFPATIKESAPDFLCGASFLEVTVRHPNHPHFLKFVRQPGKGLYRLALGEAEVERMREGLKLTMKDADTALRFAQWRLAQTEGVAFWLVSSVEQVPFLPVTKDDPESAARIEKAKAELAPKIVAPSVRALQEEFVVSQTAVVGRDLVRYEARVGRDGAWSSTMLRLATDIPVVYVVGK